MAEQETMGIEAAATPPEAGEGVSVDEQAEKDAGTFYPDEKKAEAKAGDEKSDDGSKGDDAKPDDKPGEGEGDSEKELEDSKEGEEQKDSKEGEGEGEQEFSLSLPEGSLLDDKAVEAVTEFAKENKLSKEQAQAVLQRESDLISDVQEFQKSEHKERVEGWAETVRTDSELGGDNFNKTAELAKRAVDAFATEEFKKELAVSGYGNHPEVVRVFAKIGESLESKALITGDPVKQEKSMEEVFYGNQ